jgi:hypothetical protein
MAQQKQPNERRSRKDAVKDARKQFALALRELSAGVNLPRMILHCDFWNG